MKGPGAPLLSKGGCLSTSLAQELPAGCRDSGCAAGGAAWGSLPHRSGGLQDPPMAPAAWVPPLPADTGSPFDSLCPALGDAGAGPVPGLPKQCRGRWCWVRRLHTQPCPLPAQPWQPAPLPWRGWDPPVG